MKLDSTIIGALIIGASIIIGVLLYLGYVSRPLDNGF